ncbi:HPr family phosphocarrier protein [Candidatus Gillettellia adelgis]
MWQKRTISPPRARETSILTIKKIIKIINNTDIHIHPATNLFKLIQNFHAEILLYNNKDTEAKTRNTLTILMLNSKQC